MNDRPVTNKWNWNAARFRSAPLALQAYTIFSIVATLYGLIVLAGYLLESTVIKNLNESIIPVTGWIGPLFNGLGLYFCIAMLILRDQSEVNRTKILSGINHILVAMVLYGIFELIVVKPNAIRSGNPYLTVSEWRPVWSFFLPVLWRILLRSECVKRF